MHLVILMVTKDPDGFTADRNTGVDAFAFNQNYKYALILFNGKKRIN